jgi:hypothetical protein
VGSVKLDLGTLRQIAKVVREESILDTIETDVEDAVLYRCRGDRVRACDLASLVFRLHRDKLSGSEIERRDFLDLELQVLR